MVKSKSQMGLFLFCKFCLLVDSFWQVLSHILFYTWLKKTRKENSQMKKFIEKLLDFYADFFEHLLYRF